MSHTRSWLWIEALLCLGPMALACLLGTLFVIHWIVTSIFFGGWIPASQYPLLIYVVGGWVGVAAILILLTSNAGLRATPRMLRFARIGVLIGAGAAVIIPEGTLPQVRFGNDFDRSREIFRSILPTICFLHFAYLAHRLVDNGTDRVG